MPTKPKNPIFGNWWKGIGQSKYASAFFDAFQNADFMSEIGVLKCNNSLKKESGTTITEYCYRAVCPSGTVYFFSRVSNKIWKRTSNGVYSVVTANSQGAHYGAEYYNGYVYFANQTNKLGRFIPDTEANRNDSWKTFSYSGLPKPMKVQNLILHIGDGNKVFTVNANDATTSALQLETGHIISCFHNYGYDLLVMTYSSGFKNHAGVFRWDTASISWSSEWYIADICVNFVIETDRTDVVFFSAGNNGNLYQFDGTYLSFWKKLRNATIEADAHSHQQSVTFQRKGLFVGQGNIYSISIPDYGMDFALNHEYVSTGGSSTLINSLCTVMSSLLVSHPDGIDTLDTNYATTTVTTPLAPKRIHDVRVYTDDLPSGTSIGIEVNEDNSGWVSKNVTSDQTDELVVKIDGDIANKRTIQARITLNPNNSGTPVTPSISHIEFV